MRLFRSARQVITDSMSRWSWSSTHVACLTLLLEASPTWDIMSGCLMVEDRLRWVAAVFGRRLTYQYLQLGYCRKGGMQKDPSEIGQYVRNERRWRHQEMEYHTWMAAWHPFSVPMCISSMNSSNLLYLKGDLHGDRARETLQRIESIGRLLAFVCVNHIVVGCARERPGRGRM